MHPSILKLAGLTETEAKVYELLVKISRSTASQLAKLAGVHRANAYDAVERLVFKGLATKVRLNKQLVYTPVSPKILQAQGEKLSEAFESEVTRLDSLFSQPKQTISAVTYEGKKGFQAILLDILESTKRGEVWYSFAAPGFAKSIIGGVFVEKFHRQRVAKGIKLVALFADNAAARKRASELLRLPLVESYLLPPGFFSPLGMWIYGDKVAINGYLEPVFSVVIENRQFAEVYRNYINIVKKKSKPFP